MFTRATACDVVVYSSTEGGSEERERFWNDLYMVVGVVNGFKLRARMEE